MNIRELLISNKKKDLLRISTAGSVDDGKSTLIGRLLYDSKTLYDDHVSSLKKDSVTKGSVGGEIDYSLLLDGLRAEREQGITIDVAYRFFSTPKRKFIIADTPGHEQYTRNMVTGASTSDLAIVLIDASKGMLPQTKRHSFIASLLGIKHIIVAVNKMDIVNYEAEIFNQIKAIYTDFAARLTVQDIHFIPLSGLRGDNVVEQSPNMPWYKGPALLDYLETVHIASDRNQIDLRFPVQYVNRPDMGFRGYCGTLSSGVIRKGDKIAVLPSGRQSCIKSIVSYDGELEEAYNPMSISVTLEDEIDVSRGDMIVHRNNIPECSDRIDAYIVWMDETPLAADRKYLMKQNNSTTTCYLSECYYKFDIDKLGRKNAECLALNEIGRVKLQLSRKIIFDSYSQNRATGAFILIDASTNLTSGAGMVIGVPTGDKMLNEYSSRVPELEAGSPFAVWVTEENDSVKKELLDNLKKQLSGRKLRPFIIDGEHIKNNLHDITKPDAYDFPRTIRDVACIAKMCILNGLVPVADMHLPEGTDKNIVRDCFGDVRLVFVNRNIKQKE